MTVVTATAVTATAVTATAVTATAVTLIAVTLIAGAGYAERESRALQLLQALPEPSAAAILLEGLPDGQDRIGQACAHLPAAHRPRVARLPPGCPCCAGNLVLRVTLNRLLRPRPTHLLIGIADAAHRAALRAFLSAPPYAAMLNLGDDVLLG